MGDGSVGRFKRCGSAKRGALKRLRKLGADLKGRLLKAIEESDVSQALDYGNA